jgi:hypothetical protein
VAPALEEQVLEERVLAAQESTVPEWVAKVSVAQAWAELE